MGQNWLLPGMWFLERQGLDDGHYSSAGCVRRLGILGKCVPKGHRSPCGTAAVGHTHQDRDTPRGPWPWESVPGQEHAWRTVAREGPITCENRGMWALGQGSTRAQLSVFVCVRIPICACICVRICDCVCVCPWACVCVCGCKYLHLFFPQLDLSLARS